MKIGAGSMKKGLLVSDLDKRCANKKIFAHPTLAADPIDAIKFRMDQQGLTQKDLESLIDAIGQM